jgi:DNA-binding transcriptional MerR regulator
MSLKDISALLGVKAYRVEYLLTHGLVPETKLRISGRRVFGPEDVANIKAHFAKKPAAKAAAKPK